MTSRTPIDSNEGRPVTADSNGNTNIMRSSSENSRKRKLEVEELSAGETSDTEDNNPVADDFPSSSSRRKVKKKRKHHSHPKRKERNPLATDSDYTVCSPANRSSVSNSEDFELLDEFSNLYASARLFDRPPGGPRPIAIDGCNVAWGHGNDQEFSYKGIVLCADYFRARGHNIVKAFVPRQHQHLIPKQVVEEMTRDEILVFTPSRQLGTQGKRISSYDDRFIVQYAVITGGVVISNDNFKDLYNEQPAWRETITNRVLQHTWISKDILMFPLDPLGRKGKKNLDEFLHFPAETNGSPSACSTSIKSVSDCSADSSGLQRKSVSWKSLRKLESDSETEE